MCKIKTHKATKLIKDNLSIFSSVAEMKETKAIFQYRFLFDFDIFKNDRLEITENQNEEEIIQQIFNMPVFYSDNAFQIPVELFGTHDFYYNNETEIIKAIHSHCIISSLHTVRYLLWKEENESVVKGTTAYAYVNRNLDNGTPGYFYLNSIKYDTRKLSELDTEQQWDHTSYETKVSNFFDQMKEKNPSAEMRFAYSLLGKAYFSKIDREVKTSVVNMEIPLYNLDFYHHIISNKEFFTNKIHHIKNIRRENFIKYMNSYGRIASSTAFYYSQEAKIDNLLLQYQLERYFNASLYEYLFQRHCNHNQNSENIIKLSGENYFSVIQKFSLLPNAFSRHIFVDWAYELISHKNSSKVFGNYFDSPNEMKFHLITNEETGQEDLKFNPHLKTPNTEYAVWCYALECALEYLSTVTFPMYEKTFFIGLYEYFSIKTLNSEGSSILKKMESFLYKYCERNCEEMLDMDLWENRSSFLSWDNYNVEQYFEKQGFYLNLIYKMLCKNNLESLYKVTFDRKYFGTQKGASMFPRETTTISYYQRQLMYQLNNSDKRDTSY